MTLKLNPFFVLLLTALAANAQSSMPAELRQVTGRKGIESALTTNKVQPEAASACRLTPLVVDQTMTNQPLNHVLVQHPSTNGFAAALKTTNDVRSLISSSKISAATNETAKLLWNRVSREIEQTAVMPNTTNSAQEFKGDLNLK